MNGKDLGNSNGTMGGMYHPDGTVQGDDTAMGDAGYMSGVTDTYGADLSGSATNRIGSMGDAAKSDPADEDSPDDPTFGDNAADIAEDRAEGKDN